MEKISEAIAETNDMCTLRGLIFAGIIFREVREFFRKFAKINPRENFKNLWIREIREI